MTNILTTWNINTFLIPILIFSVALFFFLIFRAILLWYWKIDRIVELLEELVKKDKVEKNKKEEKEITE